MPGLRPFPRLLPWALLVLAAACGDCDDEPPQELPTEGSEPAGEATLGEQGPSPGPRAEAVERVPEARPSLALGGRHSCLLDAGGRVRCWGENRFAQLGDPELETGQRKHRARAVAVTGLDDAVALAAGTFHTCAVRADGNVACWGHGGWGQLGDTGGHDGVADEGEDPISIEDRARPTSIDLDVDVVEIAAGESHTCARLANRQVRCWGANVHGQLGDGTRTSTTDPVDVVRIEDVVSIVAGRAHTCARTAAGEVYCWGIGVDGQLGDGTRGGPAGARARPTPVELGAKATQLAAGGQHVCALLGSGEVRCWGANDSGQLGTGAGGDPSAAVTAPAAMADPGDVAELALGGRHSCVRRRDGTAACAGFNHDGQLGDGTTELRHELVVVKGLDDAVHLAAGAHHTCAIRGDGGVACWGRGYLGRLGDGAQEDRTEPVPVHGVPKQALEHAGSGGADAG